MDKGLVDSQSALGMRDTDDKNLTKTLPPFCQILFALNVLSGMEKKEKEKNKLISQI